MGCHQGQESSLTSAPVARGGTFPLQFPGQSPSTNTKRLPREKSPSSEQAQAQVVFIADFPNSLFSLYSLRTTTQSNGSAPDPSAPPTAANPSEEAFCSTRHHLLVTLSTTFPLTNTSVYSLEFCNIEPREIHHLHTLLPCQYCMNAISLSPPQLLP